MFKSFFKGFFAQKRMTAKSFQPQEIWWSSFDGGEGPVVVFRKFGNGMLWALPLTAKGAGREPSYFMVPMNGKSKTALSRMRMLTSDRLQRKLGKMSVRQFGALNMTVMQQLHISDPARPRVQRPLKMRPVAASPRHVIRSASSIRPVSVFPAYARA